jgi:serine/threonine-protein kinase
VIVGLSAGVYLAQNQKRNINDQKISLEKTKSALMIAADTEVAGNNTQIAQKAKVSPIPNQPAKPPEKDGMEMVYVPAGDFKMGSLDTDRPSATIERPQRSVFLDAFWIDKTEVTNKMYEQCTAEGKCKPPESKASSHQANYYGNSQFNNYPMINVAWEDARSYCTWAGRQLPSEAQWEKAARGTDARIYPWGNTPPSESLTNFSRLIDDTSPVGSYPDGKSAYGAMDMAGNVWEWVADWYSDSYYTVSPGKNPTGPATGTLRILRGGSYYNLAFALRVAARLPYAPTLHSPLAGFRCAQPASSP